MKSIIGRKIGMTSVFATDGTCYPVSVIEVLPNVVTQKKTIEKDGYEALQIGYEEKKENRANKPEKGIFAKANTTPKYHLFELKGDEIYSKEVGETIDCSIFQAGDNVDVTGTSKGRGYLGTIQRYNQHIGPKGHGSGYHRQIGSLANNGRCNYTTTTLNLTVVSVDVAKNCILIKGSVPGPNKSIVKIRTAVKAPNLKHDVKPLVNYDEGETK